MNICISNGVYTLLKKISCYSTQLFSNVSFEKSRHRRFSMVQQILLRYKELGLGGFYYSIRKKLPSPSIYLKPTTKKYYRKKNHAYLNLMYSICHIVNIYRLGKSTKFPMLSISIPSSSYSTTKTLSERFSSSSVNT